MNTPALDDLEQAYEPDFNEESGSCSGSELENSFILEEVNNSSGMQTGSLKRAKPIPIVPSIKPVENEKISSSFERIKSSCKNAEIDKLTLELLINKNQYNKYLSKTDPHKYQEHQEHLTKIRKYKGRIMAMTSDLLDDPNCQINNEINEQMDVFVRCCIRYLEIQDRWHGESPFNQSSADEDVLFPDNNMVETPVMHSRDNCTEHFDYGSPMKSFWGKPVNKQPK
jgi:hypothetical protein